MNRSGEAVQPFAAYYDIGPDNIIVVQDDLDLSFGRLKIKGGGGSGGHKGIESIEQRLGSAAFIRIRVGLGERGLLDASDFVLGKFTPEQEAALLALFERTDKALRLLLAEGIESAMTATNADDLHE